MDTVWLYKNETGVLLTVFVKREKRRKKLKVRLMGRKIEEFV